MHAYMYMQVGEMVTAHVTNNTTLLVLWLATVGCPKLAHTCPAVIGKLLSIYDIITIIYYYL